MGKLTYMSGILFCVLCTSAVVTQIVTIGEDDERLQHKRPKVAVLFFGLTRSLNSTIESIEKNIYEPFRDNDIHFHVFVHTYEVKGRYVNNRSNEDMDVLTNNWELLRPDYIHVEVQEGVIQKLRQFTLEVCSFGLAWGSEETTRNALLALHSQKMLVDLVKRSRYDFDGILLLRPDLKYVDPIDVLLLELSIRWKMIVTPNSISTISTTPCGVVEMIDLRTGVQGPCKGMHFASTQC